VPERVVFLENVLAGKPKRVSQFAKELGVTSKAILDWCKKNDLGEVVPNHMTMLKLGLMETLIGVKDQLVEDGGGVAVVEHPSADDEASAKTKKPRKGKKAVVGGEEAVAAPVAEHPATEPVAVVPVVVPPAGTEILHPGVEPALAAPSVVADVPSPVAPAQTVASAAGEVAIVTETVAGVTPVPAVAMPVAHAPEASIKAARPTIRVDDRSSQRQAPPVRKTVIPAPQLTMPEPAKIVGPRLVREEKPDLVPTPRRQVRPGDGPSANPSFVQARAQQGRGVKSADDETDESADAKKKAASKAGRSLSARRRGADGRRGDAIDKIKEFSEQDLAERRRRIGEAAKHRLDFDRHLEKVEQRGHHALAKTTVEKGEPIQVEEPVTVRSLGAALGIKGSDIIAKLLRQGIFANINQALDTETAQMLAMEYGLELTIRQATSLEEDLEQQFAAREHKSENLVTRPPVVTILGHVDHGKTSLLDKIRNADVAAHEAGGITQHTAAWMVTFGEGEARRRVTFIDTPGHQAFTKMRARGANMTDVVVLVVSAAEGVQPQTIESINHARAAGVPIVVALNKIDRPDANVEMVLGQLAAQGLNPVEYGGETEVVRTSATTGQGIEALIEILDLQAQIMELKADLTVPARGTVIEARVDEGLGAVATVLVQDGTLRVGDVILSGATYGRIRSLLNDRGESIPEAGPAMPVIVSGLNNAPASGDKFYVTPDIDQARAIAEERAVHFRQSQLAAANKIITGDNLIARITEGGISTINLIIKADVQGSVETLVNTVTNSNTEEVKVRVVHSGVGAINESDVELAIATLSKATDNRVSIIGFHVVPDESARFLAEQNRVEIKLYQVIYEIFDDLRKALSGMLEPEVREKLHGHAEIRQVYKVSKIGNIAGCFVTDGHIQRGSKIRLIRNSSVLVEDLSLESLKRVKDDAKEVKAGLECGMKLAGYDDIKVGDVLEAYIRETFQRTL